VPPTTGGDVCVFRLGGKCVPSNWSCATPYGPADCQTGFKCGKSCAPQTQTCTKNIDIALSTTSNTPNIDSIWSRLVAGPEAIFKRIFPKTNTEGSVGKIIDIPGSTNISYSGSGVNQADASLKFPHIGGISEYFLKGIQTALRPKGFGDPITFGPNDNKEITSIDCDQSAGEVSLPKTLDREHMYQYAVNNVGGQLGNHVMECYNDVVKKSLAAGVDPGFTLFLWLNESNASNSNLTNLDFGVTNLAGKGFTAQIQRFLGYPSAYKSNFPQCFGKGDDTGAFWAIFLTGNCTPGAGKPYTDLFTVLWSAVSQCPIPTFPFKASCY
jgi:hypothetical protein